METDILITEHREILEHQEEIARRRERIREIRREIEGRKKREAEKKRIPNLNELTSKNDSITLGQASKILDVYAKTVMAWVKKGILSRRIVGRRNLFNLGEVLAIKEKRGYDEKPTNPRELERWEFFQKIRFLPEKLPTKLIDV